ncbi:antigen 43 domain protein [Escherichia coli p0305293.13]|nr:antigen 43 domain protein [Escherichia coli p0305293.13]
MLEPQLHNLAGTSLDDGQDNAGYVKFGHGSAQHVRAGFRLGSHNDMTLVKAPHPVTPARQSKHVW